MNKGRKVKKVQLANNPQRRGHVMVEFENSTTQHNGLLLKNSLFAGGYVTNAGIVRGAVKYEKIKGEWVSTEELYFFYWYNNAPPQSDDDAY